MAQEIQILLIPWLLLKDLDQSHQHTAGRVENVASQVGNLKSDVNHMEGRLRGEVKSKLEDVRSVLLTALEKATQNLKEIQDDVKKGRRVGQKIQKKIFAQSFYFTRSSFSAGKNRLTLRLILVEN